VYLRDSGVQSAASVESAKFYTNQIGEGISWVKTKGRFYTDAQRNEVIDLFKQGQDWYCNLI